MTIASALSDPTILPAFSRIAPDSIAETLTGAISEHERLVSRLTASPPVDFASAWMPLERADNAIEALWSAVGHLHSVADTPEIRTAYSLGQAQLVGHSMTTLQNRDLYAVLERLAGSAEFKTLSDADRVAVEHALRDFRQAGVALEPEARARFATITTELSRLSTDFSSAVLDATDAWSEHVSDASLLAGLSGADKAMLADAARQRGLEGWLVTLQAPSSAAILTFAEDRGLRFRVYEASTTRASDQGPHAGTFDNSDRIARIVALRREAAALLGYSDPVARSLATKMASSADEILGFLNDLAARAKPFAEREFAELRDFARSELGIEDFQPWDAGFAANLLCESRFKIDEAEVKTYFPAQRVLAGWQALLATLYGIRLVERDDVDLWHGDARYFDVMDESGTVFAGLYLDLYARAGKRSGAWMAPARPRLRDGNTVTLPVAYLVCNFAPPTADLPSLLSHDDVITLLHESGHGLQHICTLVDRPSVGGISGFEWDAVELPSQLMEDFAWDRSVLTGMSGHYETGAPLPAELFDRLLAARHFQSGMFLVRQVEFALFDLMLHLGTYGDDPMTVIQRVRDEVAVIHPPVWNRFPHGFNHIFAGGYAAGYYSYLWAEVLSADGFAKFADAGLLDRATGDAFRREVLAMGAIRPAAESFRAFRGRAPNPNALLVRKGLAG